MSEPQKRTVALKNFDSELRGEIESGSCSLRRRLQSMAPCKAGR